MPTPVPCRLHFLFARAAPTAVVLRRGPTRWVQAILWDVATDRFDPGQWFHGRIYERRCDLSPDGKLMVYFAAKHGRDQYESEYTETWTAVSKPPWFTALALWPNGDTWTGGGTFADDRTLLLNQGNLPHPRHDPKGRLNIQVRCGRGKEANPQLAGGWIPDDGGPSDVRPKRDPAEAWLRPHPYNRPWHAVRRRHKLPPNRRGSDNQIYDETFALRSADGRVETPLPDVEWADWDQRGRLILARAGTLVALNIEPAGTPTENVLADFNSAVPTPLVAPEWATRW